MKNPEREKNLERIKELHTALRHAACGACPGDFEEIRLGTIAGELRARIEVEKLCVQMDEPTYFMELIQKGKDVVLQKMAEKEAEDDDDDDDEWHPITDPVYAKKLMDAHRQKQFKTHRPDKQDLN